MKRSEMLAAMEDRSTVWDMIVIGGGATGLGAAVEAAARGHRTVLVEAEDFAKGTSSRSTKLIHGGVRYLRQGRIGRLEQVEVVLGKNEVGGPFATRPVPATLDWNLWLGPAADRN